MTLTEEPFKEYHVLKNQKTYVESTINDIEFIRAQFYSLRDDDSLRKTKETKELLHELCHFTEKLKIDIELFKNSPPEWQDRWGNREIVTQRECVNRFAGFLRSPNFAETYREKMSMPTKRPENFQEYHKASGTIIRQTNEWAVENLKNLHRLLKPLVTEAEDRVQQYTDHLGISGRYENYRKSCNNPRFKYDQDGAMKTVFRPNIAPRWHLGQSYLRAQRLGVENFDKCPKPKKIGDWPKNAIEAASIIERFPGDTEYQEKYVEPFRYMDPPDSLPLPSTFRHISEQPQEMYGRGVFERSQKNYVDSKGYRINPVPKIGALFSDRDLIPPPKWEFPKSEVQTSYVDPFCKLPHRSLWESGTQYL